MDLKRRFCSGPPREVRPFHASWVSWIWRSFCLLHICESYQAIEPRLIVLTARVAADATCCSPLILQPPPALFASLRRPPSAASESQVPSPPYGSRLGSAVRQGKPELSLLHFLVRISHCFVAPLFSKLTHSGIALLNHYVSLLNTLEPRLAPSLPRSLARTWISAILLQSARPQARLSSAVLLQATQSISSSLLASENSQIFDLSLATERGAHLASFRSEFSPG